MRDLSLCRQDSTSRINAKDCRRFHELAHCCLHQTARRPETTKRIRETEAEAVAFVVCNAIGLETGTASQDYVGLYGGDARLLLDSLEYVQQTASRILTAIAPENSGAPA
jgi:hypothetical protein